MVVHPVCFAREEIIHNNVIFLKFVWGSLFVKYVKIVTASPARLIKVRRQFSITCLTNNKSGNPVS